MIVCSTWSLVIKYLPWGPISTMDTWNFDAGLMSIVTPFECSVPWEKKSFPPHSAVQIFSSSGFEKVSCKLKIVAFWFFK